MRNFLHRRDRLLITTIEIIDELGLQGLSTREIANREGVSEATLFRHYKNKNDLLMAVLIFFTKFDEDIYQTAMNKNLEPLEAIRFLISATVEYYENYPAITAITQVLDVLQYEPYLAEKARSIIFARSQYIIQLIDQAKSSGDLQPEINSESLSDIITGTIREICLKWRTNRKFSLKERTISTTNILLDSFSLKKS